MRLAPSSCLILALASGLAGAQTHTLGIVAPIGESTIAYDMNAAGQVAAVHENEDGQKRGLLFANGVATELSLVPGAASDARAINASGTIVGTADNAEGRSHAYVYARATGMRDLGTLGGTSSFGMDINRAGHTVGFADTADGDSHAFLHDGTAMRDLGTLGGKISYASGMNNVGQVVGTAAQADDYRRAFVYDAVRGMVNLGTLGGRSSAAAAINDAGTVVGAAQTSRGAWHAFVYEHGKMMDLGALFVAGSSFATGINSAGHVVGTSIIGDERRSFVWHDGRMTIHRGGRGLYLTNRINDAGQVIGAIHSRTLSAATMPANAIPAATPEIDRRLTPVMVLCVLVGVGAVLWRRRYRGMAMPAAAA